METSEVAAVEQTIDGFTLTTINQQRKSADESMKELEEQHPNLKDISSHYSERDQAYLILADDFYMKIGLDKDAKIAEIWCDDGDVKVPEMGWTQVVGEEVERIFKDGKEIGRMICSCRGSMYRATMQIVMDSGEPKEWEATNMVGLVQQAGCDKWLEPNSSLWIRS